MDYAVEVLNCKVQLKEINGTMWAVANDIGRVLGLARTRDTVDRYVSSKNKSKRWVRYLTGQQQRYYTTLLNADGVIEILTNTEKGSPAVKRALNENVVSVMLDKGKCSCKDKEKDLHKLNSELLLSHIYKLRGELEKKDKELGVYKDKINSIKGLIERW